ncbi:hypothetical protein [Schaalia sp. ZJ1691]|uniref:hypothetical protein n=1 Tax=Schaalia sp. ZJ1691 TaxID=2709404 RepID=UPI0013EDF2E7|nr:hypothetical protein [Schaalia sp. ZJ1691]
MGKVQDEAEALRLLRDEGYTYQQMVDFYLEKYGIETSTALWSRFLKKANGGDTPRLDRYESEVPWVTVDRPKNAHYASALRTFGRLSRGEAVPDAQVRMTLSLRQKMMAGNKVVDYDYDTATYKLVSRRDGVDTGWIRDPFLDDEGNLATVNLDRIKVGAFAERMRNL